MSKQNISNKFGKSPPDMPPFVKCYPEGSSYSHSEVRAVKTVLKKQWKSNGNKDVHMWIYTTLSEDDIIIKVYGRYTKDGFDTYEKIKFKLQNEYFTTSDKTLNNTPLSPDVARLIQSPASSIDYSKLP